MKTALMFPGQGSVFPGMGKDIYEDFREARELYELAASLTGRNIAALSFKASRRQLVETANAHLVVFVHSLAVYRILSEGGVAPDFFSGHSLGQWAAVTAAGALPVEDGLRFVERRGTLLAESCRRFPGGMMAIRSPLSQEIEGLIDSIPGGGVSVANINGRDEIVLSGGLEGLKTAMKQLRGQGIGVSLLGVGGAFHTPGMAGAAREFTLRLENYKFRDPRRPVVSTRSGALLTTAAEIKSELSGHMLHPVRWDLVLETLSGLSVDRWIEVGPGRVLTGLAMRWDRGSRCFPTSRSQDIRRILEKAGDRPASAEEIS